MTSQKNILLLVLFFIFAFSLPAHANYPIEKIGLDSTRSDFVIGPGKQEFVVNPGETVQTEIVVSNRMGEDRNFEINIEDFVGSRVAGSVVTFLTDKDNASPYSLKNYIKFSDKIFTLPNSYRARIPVQIKVPLNAEPGGLYGSVLISTVKSVSAIKTEKGEAAGGIPINLRSGVLFFVRVAGNVKEEGKMTEFKVVNDKKFFSGGEPVKFQIVFENNGSVHLNPSGNISIKNIAGQEANKIELDPWFVMPDSLRSREISLNPGLMMGRYVAEADIYRGFGDIADPSSFDKMSLVFWVIPWSKIIILFVIIIILVFLFKWLGKNFEFKRKG